MIRLTYNAHNRILRNVFSIIDSYHWSFPNRQTYRGTYRHHAWLDNPERVLAALHTRWTTASSDADNCSNRDRNAANWYSDSGGASTWYIWPAIAAAAGWDCCWLSLPLLAPSCTCSSWGCLPLHHYHRLLQHFLLLQRQLRSCHPFEMDFIDLVLPLLGVFHTIVLRFPCCLSFYLWQFLFLYVYVSLSLSFLCTNIDSKFHSYFYWFCIDSVRWFSICSSDAHCCLHTCWQVLL